MEFEPRDRPFSSTNKYLNTTAQSIHYSYYKEIPIDFNTFSREHGVLPLEGQDVAPRCVGLKNAHGELPVQLVRPGQRSGARADFDLKG